MNAYAYRIDRIFYKRNQMECYILLYWKMFFRVEIWYAACGERPSWILMENGKVVANTTCFRIQSKRIELNWNSSNEKIKVVTDFPISVFKWQSILQHSMHLPKMNNGFRCFRFTIEMLFLFLFVDLPLSQTLKLQPANIN